MKLIIGNLPYGEAYITTVCGILFNCRFAWHIILKWLGDILEEIMLKNYRKTAKQLYINVWPMVYVIHILPAAIQLSGEPSDGAAAGLRIHHLPYFMADM